MSFALHSHRASIFITNTGLLLLSDCNLNAGPLSAHNGCNVLPSPSSFNKGSPTGAHERVQKVDATVELLPFFVSLSLSLSLWSPDFFQKPIISLRGSEIAMAPLYLLSACCSVQHRGLPERHWACADPRGATSRLSLAQPQTRWWTAGGRERHTRWHALKRESFRWRPVVTFW